ncbi:invasion associated locus B family protein [Szabonella alba]|uniref:Invasion associated locus B family protein n=1 Tax=Szabonella alba TaxID=2804194 RepID=A0A8K0V7K1_9RHOB|nr:invasion associated locus B family protein [Szabonella alba]MBL4917199.1 invasion associated locus B family protein [Szabonella alba]
MTLTKTSLLTSLFALAFAGSVAAQDTTAPAAEETPPAGSTISEAPQAADSLSMGRDPNAPDPDAIGATYTASEHGDWERRCVRTEDGADPCQLYQLLEDSDGNPVAEISIFGLPDGQQAAAGATVIVPLETLLTEEMTIQIDAAQARKYPFSWCSQIGCIARIGFTTAEIDAFKRGNKAEITIVPVVAPDQRVTVAASLVGFTAGYDAVNTANGN